MTENESNECWVKTCKDPKTGKMVVKYGESCPPGWVESVGGAAAARGIDFRKDPDLDLSEAADDG